MQLSIGQTHALLRNLGDLVADRRRSLGELERRRDELLRALDGQPGMRRGDMARLSGMTTSRLSQIILAGHPEAERMTPPQDVPEDLREAIRDAVGRGWSRVLREGVQVDA